jgi:hypothetical protein
MSLEERYANDPKLLNLYKKKFPEPGWAGELNQDELSYIIAQLVRSHSLKRNWGFKPLAKRLSEKYVRTVAISGLRAIRRRVLASAVEKE